VIKYGNVHFPYKNECYMFIKKFNKSNIYVYTILYTIQFYNLNRKFFFNFILIFPTCPLLIEIILNHQKKLVIHI